MASPSQDAASTSQQQIQTGQLASLPSTSSNMPLSLLETLPVELMNNVLEMAGERKSYEEKRKMYYNICLVSRTLNATATAFLYRRFTNEGKAKPLSKFLWLVAKYPGLAQHVQDVHLSRWPSNVSGVSQTQMVNTITAMSAGKQLRRDHIFTNFKKDIQEPAFRNKVSLFYQLLINVKNITLDLSDESSGATVNRGDDAQVLVNVALNIRADSRFEVLSKLRALKIVLGRKYDHQAATWTLIREALDIPSLEEFSFSFANYLPPIPAVAPNPLTNVKSLTLNSRVLHLEYVVHVIQHFRRLEHLSLTWEEQANYFGRRGLPAVGNQPPRMNGIAHDFHALVDALLPHKDSLRSLSISSRLHGTELWGPIRPIESLAMFERLEDLSLDDTLITESGSFYYARSHDPDVIHGYRFPPNLKKFTICAHTSPMALFNILGKLAIAAPASLQTFKATFMSPGYYYHSFGSEAVPELPGYRAARCKTVSLERNYNNNRYILTIRVDSFPRFVLMTKSSQDTNRARLDTPLPKGFPVCEVVRDLIDGTPSARLFVNFLPLIPSGILGAEDEKKLERNEPLW